MHTNMNSSLPTAVRRILLTGLGAAAIVFAPIPTHAGAAPLG